MKLRTIRFVIANLCMIPSWILSYFESDILSNNTARKMGIDNYCIDILHFSLLYFFLYGLLPLIFQRFKGTHQDIKYSQLIIKN